MPSTLTSTRLADVGRLAVMQGGVVTRGQLTALGLAPSTIADLVRRYGWTATHAGVYVLPGVRDDVRSRLWSAVLALSAQDVSATADHEGHGDPIVGIHKAAVDRVVVTGMSAAWLRDLVPRPPNVPQLLLDRRHHPARRGIRVVRGRVDASMWSLVDNLPVALGPRLMWDVAWTQRRWPGALNRLVDLMTVADRTRFMAVDELLAVVEDPAVFGLPPRRPRLLRYTAEVLRPGFSHSKTESMGRAVVIEEAEALGLVAEPRPMAVYNGDRIVAEADVAILSLRHDVEIDGPHHLLQAQQQRDRKRDAKLARIDWTVTRYTTDLIHAAPDDFRGRIRADLTRRLSNAPNPAHIGGSVRDAGRIHQPQQRARRVQAPQR